MGPEATLTAQMAGASWRERIGAGGRWMMVVWIVLAMATPARLILASVPMTTETVALLLVEGACLVAIAAVLLRRDTVAAALAVSIAAAAAQIALCSRPTSEGILHGNWPFIIIIALITFTSFSLTGGWRWLAGIVIWTPGTVGRILAYGATPELLGRLSIETSYTIGTAFAVIIATDGLRACGDEADLVTQRLLDANAKEAVTRRVARERQAAERFLHDTIVHALRAIALPAGVLPPGKARDYARQALIARQDSENVTAGDDLVSALSELVAREPLFIAMAGQAPGLPSDVISAFCVAIREAIRNIVQHAGVDRAELEIEPLPGHGATVVIRDRGTGFDKPAPYGHRGLSDVIVGGMRAVGGSATIMSTPGEGTTVTLSWAPHQPIESTTSLLQDLSRRSRRVLSAIPVPWITAAFGATLIQTMRGQIGPTVLVAMTLAFVTAVVVNLRAMEEAFTAARAALVWLLATAATLVNILQLPPAATDDMYQLAVAGSGLMMFIIFFRPIREALLYVISYPVITVGVLVSKLGLEGSVPEFVPSIIGQLTGIAVALTLRFVLDVMNRGAHSSFEEEAQVVATGNEASLISREISERMRRLNPTHAFFRRIASGELEPDDPEAKKRAHLLELSLRDELHLHGPVPGEIQLLLWRLREEGTQVTLSVQPGALAANTHQLEVLLSAAEGLGIEKITVSMPTGEVVLMVTPAFVPTEGTLPPEVTATPAEGYAQWRMPTSLALGAGDR